VTPQRWQRIKQVFQATADLAPADRDTYLDTETDGDPQLRSEVEKMLRHADGTGLLDQPAWDGRPLDIPIGTGSRLGPYEIVEEVGAGGMGRVFKARDTRIGRIVAIKVLSAEFSHRLRLEARAVSALNHPHVCALYDIGDQDGAAYLVMEYVEGESLAASLTRGPLPYDTVLRYGAEIAGALAAAHTQGIVHRDLKPANIMVTSSGIKVLDFGVARIAQDGDTSAGDVVGTAAYMSPSQWNGNPADARSDIFALGLVLFEMATGTRPSRQSRILSGSIAGGLAAVIDCCLEPNAAHRTQSMDQVRAALDRLRTETPKKPRYRWSRPTNVAGIASGAVALAALAWTIVLPLLRPVPELAQLPASVMRPPGPPPDGYTIPSPQPSPILRRELGSTIVSTPHPSAKPPSLATLASYPGQERDPSFSPDGSKVAFAWHRGSHSGFAVAVRGVSSDDPPAVLTSGAFEDWGPTWSPDGRRVAFRRRGEEPGIYWINATGGSETFVAPIARQDSETLPQMSWSRDGKWIAAPDRDSAGVTHINLVSVASGQKRELTANPNGIDHAPSFSPDGKSLAYASCRGGVSPCDVYVLDLDRNLAPLQQRRITDQGVYIRGIAWAPDGRGLVYSAGRTRSQDTYLWRVAANPPGLPERIDLAGSSARHPTVSAKTDLLAYTRLSSWKLMMISNFH
jgi:serine/threonine protein kinase